MQSDFHMPQIAGALARFLFLIMEAGACLDLLCEFPSRLDDLAVLGTEWL